jgi:small subunit ribosomal protein S15
MARMHSGGKGKSGSTRPDVREVPEWSEKDTSAVESLILELHEEGNSNAMIGTILRDQHSVPSVKLLLGKTLGSVLTEAGKTREVPEELMNMMRKAQVLIDHLEGHRKDLHNGRQLNLIESKIRRSARYYKANGMLAEEWNYKRDQLRLMVE